MKTFQTIFLAISFLLFHVTVTAQVKLPSLVSDGMVLQQNSPLRIWGWDKSGQKVTVELNTQIATAETDTNGRWEVSLPSMPAGGPYTIKVNGSTEVIIRDVLIGDVWICSGQSNMELNMNRASPLYGSEIANSENDRIRYFAAPQTYDFVNRVEDFNGGKWQKPNPQTVLGFGAIAYFFAREVNSYYDIPVGIINTAIGGTPTEAWISEEALQEFPVHFNELQRFKNQALIDSIEKQNHAQQSSWYTEAGKNDRGHLDANGKWMLPGISTASWDAMNIPGYWAQTGIGPVNGIFWFRKVIEVPEYMAGKAARLLLGRIVDADSVFINGKVVGSTGYQYPPRRYEIPTGLLHAGGNTIAVKIISNSGMGGFVPDKPYYIISESDTISLSGEWLFKLGAKMSRTPGGITVKYKPSGLFNAMIAPLLNYTMKGCLWYQGESNTGRSEEQRKLFPALINDWRNNWQLGDFPFLYVQLPNFMEAKEEPSESDWARFREAQLQTLSLPNTAMAVTIDVGEWNDIHPLNKLDVARRLFIAARHTAYGEKVVYSGPLYKSMKIKGDRIILDFAHKGRGLLAKGSNKLNGFSIAGKDQNFVWADAEIKNNKIIVRNSKVTSPVAVRYAWADNPQNANLFNADGLPASPFRTDSW